MPVVKLNSKNTLELSIRKLKRLVEKSGITKELRGRERYIKPSKVRQKKIIASKKRLLKNLQKRISRKL